MNGTILDVGSGANPCGDVNCDIYLGATPHTTRPVKRTSLFIRCDAQYLPFKAKSFDIIHCSEVLEHLPRPFQALGDFNRVARRIVYVKTPNSVCLFQQHDEHLHSWDRNTLRNLLQKIFPKVTIYQSTPQTPLFNSRLFDKFHPIKFLVEGLFRHLINTKMTAICMVKQDS